MSKRLVTELFIGSLVAAVGGIVLLLVVVALGSGGDVFVMQGPDVVGVRSSTGAWMLLGLGILAFLALLGGGLVQLVAWIGAVLDAARLPSPTLLVVLLVTGLLSFGLVGMIIYLVLAPADDAPERIGTPAAQDAAPEPAVPTGTAA